MVNIGGLKNGACSLSGSFTHLLRRLSDRIDMLPSPDYGNLSFQENAVSATNHRTTTPEAILSLLILAFLVAIVLVILSVQSRFNPAVINFTPENIQVKTSDTNKTSGDLSIPLPVGIETMSFMENFSPETLSDKINGKAELYLSAGFVGLQTQRYRSSTDPEQWFEVFIYDMGKPDNAFAVYSTQRRQDVEKLHLANDAYRTGNALFFITGQHYVEIIAATQNETITSMLITFAENYLDHIQPDGRAQTDASDPKGVFPSEGQDADSIALIAKDAFGFSGLDQVYTAQYHWLDAEISLFISLRSSPKEAKTLAGAYRDFLVQFGGTVLAAPESSPVEGLVTVGIMDAYELIFFRGPYLTGVHMADDIVVAGKLAVKMDRKLAEMGIAK